MPPAPYRAAIFDMDGLLIDSERPVRDAWLRALQEFGVTLDHTRYLDLVGRNQADSQRLLQAWMGPACSYAEARRRAECLLDEALGAEGYVVKAGVVSLLETLRARRVPCVVASSTHREEVEWRLAQAGLAPFFDGFNGGDEVQRGKPHPDLFLLAARRLATAPQHCLVFEDSDHGARGALAAGMSVVVVPDLKRPGDDTCAASVAVLASLHDAQQHLGRWFGEAPGHRG